MSQALPTALTLTEGRFARLEAIEWWDQSLLRNARILVVGAGALGNEIIKNLALLGVGNVIIVDMDRIELSNLSRSVLPVHTVASSCRCRAFSSSICVCVARVATTPAASDSSRLKR